MHALRHLAVVKAQQKEFALAMDVRDAADRLCEDQRLSAERAVLDDARSVSDIATLLAKQGRELGELRARHRATRARLDRELASWGETGERGVFFPGPESSDERQADPAPRPAASSPAPRALAAPAAVVTPSWGAFRTPAGETRRHAGTATKAFLEAGGHRFEAVGVSSRFPEAEKVSPAIRALDFDVSDAGDVTALRGGSTQTTPRETPRGYDKPPDTRDARPRPASAWSRFGRRRSWLRRPSENAEAVAAAGVGSSSSRSSPGRHSPSPWETTKDSSWGNRNTEGTTAPSPGTQTRSRAVLLSIPRLALPAGEARAAEREDWRAVSSGAPADVAPPTAADDWRSLAMMRARDPGTRAAAARAYGEYRDALDVVSSDANDPKRVSANRGFAGPGASAAETRRASFLGRRDRSYSSDLVGFDDRENAQDAVWARRGPTGPTGRRAPGRIEDARTAAAEKKRDDDDATTWTRRGASLRRQLAGVGESRRRSVANAPPVAVDASAPFVHEALRPLDDERIREEDARVRAGGGAKGRLPTGVFFETRRGSLAETTRAGAPSPSNRTRDATPVSVRT